VTINNSGATIDNSGATYLAKTETICIWATSQWLQCPGLKQTTTTTTTTNLLDCSRQLVKENKQQNNHSSEQNFLSSMMLQFFTVFTVPGTVPGILGPRTYDF